MKFVEYKGELPRVERMNNRDTLRSRLVEFMNLNIKIAKIELDENEYKNVKTAAQCIRVAIKRWSLPITAHQIGENIYLINEEL